MPIALTGWSGVGAVFQGAPMSKAKLFRKRPSKRKDDETVFLELLERISESMSKS